MSSAPSNKRKKSSECESESNHNHKQESEENKTKEAKTEQKEEEKKYPKIVNSVCHIDIPVVDVERACDFYRDAFSWTFMKWKPEYCLWIGVDKQCISGGFVLEKKESRYDWPIPRTIRSVTLYMISDEINAHLNTINKSGGIVLSSRHLIAPTIGSQAFFYDSEGNYMALYSKDCEGIVETKTLEQTVALKGSPHVIFEKMMDEKLLTAFLGEESKLNRKEGGEFKISKGYITGRTIRVEKDHLIGQSWRASDWPPGHFSILAITLNADTKTGGTTLTLKQEGVPVANFDGISKGWQTYYWDKIDN